MSPRYRSESRSVSLNSPGEGGRIERKDVSAIAQNGEAVSGELNQMPRKCQTVLRLWVTGGIKKAGGMIPSGPRSHISQGVI